MPGQREKLCIFSHYSIQLDHKTDDNSRHAEHHEDAKIFPDETRIFFGDWSLLYSHRRFTALKETFDSTAGVVISSTQEQETKEQ